MTNEPDETEPPPMTAPESIPFSVRGAKDDEAARRLTDEVGGYVRFVSRYIDLSNLDGITLANDYDQALLDLDRGYATKHKLTATKEGGVGIAMTPAVIRNGVLRSHIVLNLGLALALEDEANDAHGLSLHTIAHECAHVEVTQRYDRVFPDELLRSQKPNIQLHLRWDAILGCWDEYAASRCSAPFGESPLKAYTELFVTSVGETRKKADECIKAYRLHGDHDRILIEMYTAYGNLLKFSSYLLGTMATFELTLDDVVEAKAAIEGHWFAPYFDRLRNACDGIWSEYGRWNDKSKFEIIGDLIEDVVKEGGLIWDLTDFKKPRFAVPHTKETTLD